MVDGPDPAIFQAGWGAGRGTHGQRVSIAGPPTSLSSDKATAAQQSQSLFADCSSGRAAVLKAAKAKREGPRVGWSWRWRWREAMSLFARLSLHGSSAGQGGGDNNAGAAAAGGALKDVRAKAGVLLKTLRPGDITSFPKKGDVVSIHYEAFTEDDMIGKKGSEAIPFDSSRSRNIEFRFKLGGGQVIEGMEVAVSKMSVGQLVEATIPYPYAYGVAGYPPVVPPRATLIFRIELIRFSSVA